MRQKGPHASYQDTLGCDWVQLSIANTRPQERRPTRARPAGPRTVGPGTGLAARLLHKFLAATASSRTTATAVIRALSLTDLFDLDHRHTICSHR
ncbi:hypothetical protein [Streptomyces sp. NPDC088763]|uniref:hypothetical protein n=1 Tax=Streptomyces sp. NPDC088763 TaxID=3365892 RepID=UPI0037FD9CC1